MATVVLSAACRELPSLEALSVALRAELERAGETEVRTFDLSAIKLAYCQGEFDCWVKTPGICRSKDAEQEIVQAVHDADSVVLLDAVTFGGHGYTLKRAQDRLICLLTPFFETRCTLTHHGSRYEKQASLFALGWMPEPDPEQTQTWLALADANAINVLAPRVGAAVVDDTNRGAWPLAIRTLLSSTAHPGGNIAARAPLRGALLDAARPVPLAGPPHRARTAAIVVGSAKIKGTSASEVMARALAARLEREDVKTDLHFATEFLHDTGRALESARAIAGADLFVLVTPLYVDALPALATHALELVAKVRTPESRPSRFTALVNCGFPEPEQTRTAFRVVRHFCDRAAYHFAGGLPLGGGGAVNPKLPLDEQHGPAEHIRRALDLAAPSLARGENVSQEALEWMTKMPLPAVAYRIIGDLGWRYQAHRNGLAQRALWARPLD